MAVRTFPLITLFGALSAILAGHFGGWTIAAGLLALAAMLAMADAAKMRSGDSDPGLTTETRLGDVRVARLPRMVLPALIATGSVAVLLQYKQQLHGFVARIEEADLRAVARLALIGLVILPALPDIAYGPFGVLNPFRVWLMVVLIVGISLAAYAAYRMLGARAGGWTAGVLGGLISSTATTANYAQSSREDQHRNPAALAIIVTASAVAFARVLAERHRGFDVLPQTGGALGLDAGLDGGDGVRLPATLFPRRGSAGGGRSAVGDSHSSALRRVVRAGPAGGGLRQDPRQPRVVCRGGSGLTDMDAITLSTVQLIQSGHLQASVAGD
ncbi:MAG: DUF4010 domain-containing protein [Bryobacterales bacterium]